MIYFKMQEECCSICYDLMDDHIVNLKCSHKFHINCIGIWKSRNNSCPLCRARINEFSIKGPAKEARPRRKTIFLPSFEFNKLLESCYD